METTKDNKRKARDTKTCEERCKAGDQDMIKHKAHEDRYRKAIVSLQEEVNSIPRDQTSGKLKLQQFLDDRFSTVLPQPLEETHKKIIMTLTKLKIEEPDLSNTEEPDSTCVSVQEKSREELKEKIEEVFDELYEKTSKGLDFTFSFPSREQKYQIFDDKTERMVLKKGPFTERTLSMVLQEGPYTKRSLNTHKTALSMKYALEQVYTYCTSGTYFTSREFYYNHKNHFINQTQSNKILEDVSLFLFCTMESIGLSPCIRGEVVGDLQLIYEDGTKVNCAKKSVHGHPIPRGINRVASIASSALFVFLVEKDTVFVKLSENKFHENFRCILVTAKGYGDIATRLLLRRIQKDLHLPMIGLTDFDPHGLEILSIYRYGSKNLSFDCRSLVIPNIRWIGILSSDKDTFGIPDHCLKEMSEASKEKGDNMAKSGYMVKNKKWGKELGEMMASKKTIGIEALNNIHKDHLVHKFLPEKLESEG